MYSDERSFNEKWNTIVYLLKGGMCTLNRPTLPPPPLKKSFNTNLSSYQKGNNSKK